MKAAALLTLSLLSSAPAMLAAAPAGWHELARTPAYELLGALDLLDPAAAPGVTLEPQVKRPDNSYTIRLNLSSAAAAPAPDSARGLAILQLELANTRQITLRSFDLLYNSYDRLVAAFPVFSTDTMKLTADEAGKWRGLRPDYFDFSPYYLEVPQPGAPGALRVWQAFAARYALDQELIRAFAYERYGRIIAAYPDFLLRRQPYRLHDIRLRDGEWAMAEFGPELFRPAFAPDKQKEAQRRQIIETLGVLPPGQARVVLPTFPTVYVLTRFSPDERAYIRHLAAELPLPANPELLVVGPGTGVDAWAASLRTGKPVSVIGISPLEIANTRASARLAGFKVEAVIGDNVVDSSARPRFGKKKFHAVFWNMPGALPPKMPDFYAPSLATYWDGDEGRRTLETFARALPGLLRRGGRALVWNFSVLENGRNLVTETFLKQGGLTVEEESFQPEKPAPGLPPAGSLYKLQRCAGRRNVFSKLAGWLRLQDEACADAQPATHGFHEIARTPAFELLQALELLAYSQGDRRDAGAADQRPDGSYTVRLRFKAGAAPGALTARGLALLRFELSNPEALPLQSCDLLYNPANRLIAVFPVFEDEALKQGAAKPEWWRKLRPAFFDLSPYYMALPATDALGSEAQWRAFAAVYAKDQALIKTFVLEKFQAVRAGYPAFAQQPLPYRLHELNLKTGEWRGYQFSPLVFRPDLPAKTLLSEMDAENFLTVFSTPRPGRSRTVLPVFPTVYSLTRPPLDERTYLGYVYNKFPLPTDPELLVVGPGTGVDAWIASLRSRRPVSVIGINPLEIANTRAAARFSGFKLDALVADNIADDQGRPRFGPRKFDAVFWNMPAVRPARAAQGFGPSMLDFWDGDANSQTLRRFAAALPVVLKQGGRALLWNTGVFEGEKNVVGEALENAGGKSRVFEMETERFSDESKPGGFLEGYIYTLGPPQR